jgi:uncharacterized membrane protein YcaP (DUF421 family)
MELVIRAVIIYVVLFVLLRVSGNRQFSELTAFDAVLLLIISEATQQALIGNQDFSITGAIVIVVSLISVDILFSLGKRYSKRIDLLLEGVPVLLMEDGQLIVRNMNRERVDEEDILAAAREKHGLESLQDVKHAILERNGTISIIPAH